MAGDQKYKVTLQNANFSYSVVVEANEKTTLEQFKELAIRKIKEQFGVDVPRDVELELEFEIIG